MDNTENIITTSSNILSRQERKILDVALIAGKLLLQSGAETFRVEDTVERILNLSDHESFDVISTLTALFVSLQLKNGEYLSVSKRIKVRGVNLNMIQEVNSISRALANHEIDVDQANQQLNELIQFTRKENTHDILLNMICTSGFCMMVGGGIYESIFAALSGPLINLADYFIRKRNLGGFVPTFLKAFLAALFVCIASRFFPSLKIQAMIGGALMLLFPGTNLTNGIRDVMNGDYLTGAANLLSALTTALALAVGAAFALMLTGVSAV